MKLSTLFTILLLTAIAGFTAAILLILKNNKELEQENWRLAEENDSLRDEIEKLESERPLQHDNAVTKRQD